MGTPAVDETVSAVVWDEQTLSTDEAFTVLANSDRRAALTSLLERESEIPVDELIGDVIEAAYPEAADVARLRERLRTAFYHKHLPKLDEAGVIEFYRATETVEPNSAIDAFEPLIEYANSL